MRVLTLSIPAGQQVDFAANGNYVRVRQSSVTLKIAHDNGDFIEVDQGDDFEFEPFQRLRVSHESGVDQQIKLVIAKGKKASASKVSGSLTLSGGAVGQTTETVTNASGLLLAANAARRFLLIQNNNAAGNVFLNLAGAAATTAGLKIGPGESLTLDAYAPTGAIYAIGDIASNADVVVIEG